MYSMVLEEAVVFQIYEKEGILLHPLKQGYGTCPNKKGLYVKSILFLISLLS